jgi:hypothetical protein
MHEMSVQAPELLAHDARKLVLLIVNDSGEFSTHVTRALRDDDAIFGEKASHLVDGGRSRLHEILSNAMNSLYVGLVMGFVWNESHARPGNGFADGFRVIGVVLARNAIRGDKVGVHAPHSVAAGLDHSGPVSRRGARLHTDKAGRQVGEKFSGITAMDASPQNGFALIVNAVELHVVLCQIDSNDANVFHGMAPFKGYWFLEAYSL